MTPQFGHAAAVAAPNQAQAPWDDTGENTTDNQVLAPTQPMKKRCYFCGGPYPNRSICPSRNTVCNKCDKKGHFARACLSWTTASKTTSAAVLDS